MVENSVVIRKLLPHEHVAYRMARLESLQRYPTLFGSTHAEEAAVPLLPFESFIQQEDPRNFVLGAFVDARLCGICGFKRETRQRTRHRGELAHLYVAPAAAGRGLGGRLVASVVRTALQDPELRQIILSVAAHNRTAIALYKRAGFREYGRLDAYFVYEDTSISQLFMVCERPSDTQLPAAIGRVYALRGA